MKPSCATYYARFPFAWTVYEDPVAHVKVVVKQTSPFIPGNYSESCLPTSVFDIDVQNRSRDTVEVSLMFVFQNGMNEENSKRELSRFEHEVFEVVDPSPSSLAAAEHQGPSIKGIQMRHTCRFQSGKPQNPPPSSTSRGACDGDGTPTSSMCWASSDAKDTSPQSKTSLDHNSFAIACSSEPGDPVTVTMCPKFQTRHSQGARRGLLFCADAWDYPIARFGSGFGLPRYFTRFFASDGAQAAAIAAYALQHVDRWTDAIVQWQAETLAQLDKTMAKLQGQQQPGRHLVPLTSEEVAFYQSQVFNELYFLVDGGSVWTDSSAGTHVGQFLYLEGHEYLMYNTYDVHFYASFALIMLWPELELSLQRDIADSVLKEDPTERTMMGEGCTRPRKVKNVVPHDVGSPSETPWVLPNVYNFQDVSNWKDLGTKFVLQVYRDVHYLQERYSKAGASPAVLTEYLRSLYRVLCIVMRHEESFDTNGDGMIDNSGFPDQTYDIWTAKGVHAYCGGLWITACEAMVAIATRLEDTPTALHYRSLADRARTVYIDQLWNPINHYFHYDNSTSAHHDSIMSDMLAGQWYARACGLPNMVSTEKIHHALAVIFRWNVQEFGHGAVSKGHHNSDRGESAWRGAVNGTRPVRDVSSRQIVRMTVDQTCLQSREVWTGTTRSEWD
eukprot:gene8556-6156_t